MTRALWLPDLAKDAGIRFRLLDGWQTRGRSGLALRGGVAHHTASKRPVDRFLAQGRRDLVGPLCQWTTWPDGTITIIASGIANHAGRDWGGNPLRQFGATSNRHVYGDEMVHPGTPDVPWPQIQLESAAAMWASVCKHHGWTSAHVVGHKDWSGRPGQYRKIDPIGISAVDLQLMIDRHLSPATTEGNAMTILEFVRLSYILAERGDPLNGGDAEGAAYWARTAAEENPDRRAWSYAELLGSPTLGFMVWKLLNP